LPTILTIWIFVQCYTFVRDNISSYINRGLARVMVYTIDFYPAVTDEQLTKFAVSQDSTLRGDPAALKARIQQDDIKLGARIQQAEKYWVHGPGQIAGFLLALVAVCILGVLLASVVGKTIWHKFERFLTKTPVLRKVYPYVKQITDFLFTRDRLSFTRVVAVQYPRKGVWSVAMVTGTGLKQITDRQPKQFLTVFVPSSPTPFTGYVITVPKEDTMDLDMNIEEALRFSISGGVITPENQPLFEKVSGEKGREST